MNDQDMEMQFANPDWQPASSRQQSLSVPVAINTAGDQRTQTGQSGSANTHDKDKAGVSADYHQGYQAAPSHTPQDKQSTPSQSKSQKGWPLFGLFTRVAVAVIWAATPLVERAFHGGWILPLLGLLFLPCTALTYTVVFALSGGVTGLNWLWIVGAVLLDLASYGGQAASRKRKS